MNKVYRSVWNSRTGAFVAVSENTSASGRKLSTGGSDKPAGDHFGLKAMAASLLLAFGGNVYALPAGGVVAAGAATVAGGVNSTTITQSTQNAVINWQSFNVAQGESVRFVQPNASSVALNRVLGADPSSILGNMSANGKVFLVNPNGVLFGQGASINVGGLVASTLNISDANFMAANYKFEGVGSGTIVNQGSINAAGGYVALLGASVSNQGLITARLGTVVMAAGNAVTLDVAGDGLLNVTVNEGKVNALVANGGAIIADGGQILMTAMAAGELLRTVVNNTGLVQAQTIDQRSGTIKLLADMQSGTVNVAGTLDASAPNGGNGGFIEASAAHVVIASGANITTAAPLGVTGTFLIDPQDFIIGINPGDNISGADLSALLVNNSVTITTSTGLDTTNAGTTPPLKTLNTNKPGEGDIYVNDAIDWTSAGTLRTTLTLNAVRDVNINAAVSATNGNFAVCCGRDVIVNGAITTVNGSVSLAAGRNLSLLAAISTTDGNMLLCAAQDLKIAAAIVEKRGSSIAGESLGLPLGLTLIGGYSGTGSITFAPGTPVAAITGPNAPVTIYYNPISYSAPTDYSTKFTPGAAITQKMLVFPSGDKTYDGSTSTVLTSLKGSPQNVTLVAGAGSTANFDSAEAGEGKLITFSGYSLGGSGADQYALATNCCGPISARTSGRIVSDSSRFVPYALSAVSLLPLASAVDLTTVPYALPQAVAFAEEEAAPVAVTPVPVSVVPRPFVAPVKRKPRQDRG